MTTKPPSPVEEFSDKTREKIAYDSVGGVETLEPNDRYRLGYHVWRWLSTRQGTLEDAVRESGARLVTPENQAIGKIRETLSARGITGV